MSQTYYSPSHEYVRIEGDIAVIGITNYAQSQLGDIVFVELPDAGRGLKRGDEAAVVESVKAASEVYTPLSGETTEVNGALADNPMLANEDPEGEGWFFKQTLGDESDLSHLMSRERYDEYLKTNS